ncbi:MAG: DNA polymerase III subunit beta [Ignavibacteriales bacterium]|nr:DNA polymerase III subunit beta [Ignavibacteriales bacterium]
MKFSAHSNELQKALSRAASVLPTRSTHPALENLLFEVKGNMLSITATDMDISMTCGVVVTGLTDGAVLIPGKRIFDAVKSLTNQQMMFTIDIESRKIKMATENGEYVLQGESVDEFPKKPDFKGEGEIEITAETLRRIISKTIFSVSADELRPAMMGVLFQFKESELCSVATDGHRLVKMITKGIKSPMSAKDIIIPAKALNILSKLAEDGAAKMEVGAGHILFQSGLTTLVSRLIEEPYPNYQSVIPSDNTKELMVSKDQMLASVRRVALFSSVTTHQIRMSLTTSELTITAEDVDFGSEAKETIACEYNGDEMEMGFNFGYIVDILTHMESDEVIFKFSSSTRAGVVVPRTQRENENVLMLVMPVRLNP